MESFTQTVKDELNLYLRHLAGRVDRIVRSLPADKVWVKPFAFGNSAGHLVLHITGNLSHYIGAQIGRSGYVRDRHREFTESAPPAVDALLAAFHEAVERTAKVIGSLDKDQLRLPNPAPEVHPNKSVFGSLVVAVSHMENHIGQLAYIAAAHGR